MAYDTLALMLKHAGKIILLVISLCVSIFLGFKTLNGSKSSVLGTQLEMVLPKTQHEFPSTTAGLTYFYEPKPNIVERWNPQWLGYEVTNTINSDTLNEPKDYPIEKPDYTYRIVTLGDSFTFGAYVNTDENYSEVLEHALNSDLQCHTIRQFDVINLGYPGYDVPYGVARFEKRGAKYSPDLVIWLLNQWDVETINEKQRALQEEFQKQGYPIYDPKTRRNTAVEMAIIKLKETVGEDWIAQQNRIALKSFANLHGKSLFIISLATVSPRYTEVLDEFTLLNTHYRYIPNLLPRYFSDTSYQLPDHHPNANAHRAIAEALIPYILSVLPESCTLKK